MTKRDRLTIGSKIRLRWLEFWRWVLHLWVRARVLPKDPTEEGIQPERPTLYVMDTYALSSVLILDKVCEELKLPRPLLPASGDVLPGEHRSWASLRRLKGLFIRRPEARRSSRLLCQLVKRACEEPDFDVQVVPVTVLVGRAPDKETGIAKILFSEDWEIGGRFRRLLSTVINGRHTFVQFSAPISLRELADEGLGASRSLSKVSRVLRTHFRRVRTAAIGPDLSHRRTLMNTVLRSPVVQQAIADKAAADNIPVEKARSIAEAHLREIAADYNYTFVRIASLALTWIWNRIYDGVEVHHFDRFAERAREHEVIYVPCHRSHMDYLLVSYLLYHNGFVPPHVAAGVNLNLPVVGRFLRMGGAFFLRRSFRAQKLYAAVFNEYLSTILARGTAIEYFVEGTRSRTGRLLPPRAGMLVMTVRGFLRNPQRPIMFQPIYLGYERVVEGASYNEELSGGKKKSESLLGLLLAFRILRRRYGEVHVSFGEPLFLNELLEDQDPDWRETIEQEGERPRWLNPLIDDLGQRIMTGINACAHVNPINLLATVMLAAPRHALDEEQLCRQLELWQRLLRKGPVGPDVKITDATPAEIIELGMEMELLVRRAHPLGDILELNDERAVELTYYRNNISHLVAAPGMIAACFLNNRSFSIARMKRIGLAVFEFIRPELFMDWDRGDFLNAMEAYVELLKEEGLLTARGERTLARLEGGSDEAHQLRLLGLSLLQTLERYYITIAVLTKNGSGALTRSELERLCFLTAQRISLLHEFEAPEFYDRTLFRQFIGQLKEAGVLNINEDERLEFDRTIERIAEDAKTILSKDVRHAIIHVAPQAWEAARAEAPEAATRPGRE